MSDHVKVLVYVRAPDARRLRGEGVTDIPTWVREKVKEAVRIAAPEKEDE